MLLDMQASPLEKHSDNLELTIFVISSQIIWINMLFYIKINEF